MSPSRGTVVASVKQAPVCPDAGNQLHWIDNLGRRSPRRLLAGLEHLEVGQDVMSIFQLVDYGEKRYLTFRIKPQTVAYKVFGDVAGTYLILPHGPGTCRLLVKLIVRFPPGLIGLFMSRFLPWGDLVMMRRQLLNLKELAEETARLEKRRVVEECRPTQRYG